jgi:hypothetical protein
VFPDANLPRLVLQSSAPPIATARSPAAFDGTRHARPLTACRLPRGPVAGVRPISSGNRHPRAAEGLLARVFCVRGYMDHATMLAQLMAALRRAAGLQGFAASALRALTLTSPHVCRGVGLADADEGGDPGGRVRAAASVGDTQRRQRRGVQRHTGSWAGHGRSVRGVWPHQGARKLTLPFTALSGADRVAETGASA